jgi:hypothetical protein
VLLEEVRVLLQLLFTEARANLESLNVSKSYMFKAFYEVPCKYFDKLRSLHRNKPVDSHHTTLFFSPCLKTLQ